ncbi:alpha/beta hydrolase [Embleya sp. NPDC050493]|uniref:alpha/beta hydrolase n=1 Tax=Embleya sp. NPDC050493 TaxID=3363989 RepID=UPI003789E7AE
MRLLAAFVACASVAGLGTAAGPARAAAEPATAAASIARPLTWQPCPEDPTADCAELTLPVDWSRPHGPSFEMAVVRRKATDPTRRIGSLVVNFGGPGSLGVDDVLTTYKDFFSAEVNARFDRVGFDPRGWGRSAAPTCPQVGPRPTADPTTPAGFAEFAADNRRLVHGCRAGTGPLYDRLDTLSVVRDIEALRAALGDRRLTFWGVSYGTLMAQQYAELFPQRVRALVADSNMDHSVGGADFLRAQAATVEDSFTEFVNWCAAAADCPLHGADVGALFERLYSRAEAGTLYEPGNPTRGVRPKNLLSAIQWKISYLKEAPTDTLADARRSAADLLAALDASPPRPAPAIPDIPDSDARSRQSVLCADWRLDIPDAGTLAAIGRRSQTIAPHMRRSIQAWDAMTYCLGRPMPVTNPPRPYRIPGHTPILLVNNLHDPQTPYSWAVHAARQIPGATLLAADGWGHMSYDKSRCAAALTDRYLIDLAMPAPDTHCAPDD